MSDPLIEARDIHAYYGASHVLHGVDLVSCFKAIEHGSGQSRRLDKFGAQYLLHTLAQDANEIAHYKGVFDKDLAYVLQQAGHEGIPMPIAELSMRLRKVLPNSNSVEELLTAWRGVLSDRDHQQPEKMI